MRLSKHIRSIAIGLSLLGASSGYALAQDWHGQFSYEKGPHKWGPHCEYRVRAAGGAPLTLFGGAHEVKKAEIRAIRDWEAETTRLFGPRYSSWERAAGKELHCAARGVRFECVAAANPCRPR